MAGEALRRPDVSGLPRAELRPDAVGFHAVGVRHGAVVALEGVSARVPRGAWTAIVGPNGAGKTSLLRAILGEVPHSGEIRIHPGPDGSLPRIGYVPQRLPFDRALPLTVVELLALGRQRRPLWLGVAARVRRAAREALAQVRAEALLDRPLGALSGGELQRVTLALALGRDPGLLLLDEPSAGVDPGGGLLLCELIEGLRRERGFTVLMITHDLATVSAHASHCICLNRSVLGEGPPQAVLTGAVLQATFGLHRGLPDPCALPGDAAHRGCAHGGGHA